MNTQLGLLLIALAWYANAAPPPRTNICNCPTTTAGVMVGNILTFSFCDECIVPGLMPAEGISDIFFNIGSSCLVANINLTASRLTCDGTFSRTLSSLGLAFGVGLGIGETTGICGIPMSAFPFTLKIPFGDLHLGGCCFLEFMFIGSVTPSITALGNIQFHTGQTCPLCGSNTALTCTPTTTTATTASTTASSTTTAATASTTGTSTATTASSTTTTATSTSTSTTGQQQQVCQTGETPCNPTFQNPQNRQCCQQGQFCLNNTQNGVCCNNGMTPCLTGGISACCQPGQQCNPNGGCRQSQCQQNETPCNPTFQHPNNLQCCQQGQFCFNNDQNGVCCHNGQIPCLTGGVSACCNAGQMCNPNGGCLSIF